MFLHRFPDEILFMICNYITFNEVVNVKLLCKYPITENGLKKNNILKKIFYSITPKIIIEKLGVDTSDYLGLSNKIKYNNLKRDISLLVNDLGYIEFIKILISFCDICHNNYKTQYFKLKSFNIQPFGTMIKINHSSKGKCISIWKQQHLNKIYPTLRYSDSFLYRPICVTEYRRLNRYFNSKFKLSYALTLPISVNY